MIRNYDYLKIAPPHDKRFESVSVEMQSVLSTVRRDPVANFDSYLGRDQAYQPKSDLGRLLNFYTPNYDSILKEKNKILRFESEPKRRTVEPKVSFALNERTFEEDQYINNSKSNFFKK